ncbi:MAG: DUF4430 domain-containing protein [Clostridia bacterium]|nr:DUF4430 domain-containing protein [Clostridia bacterium]
MTRKCFAFVFSLLLILSGFSGWGWISAEEGGFATARSVAEGILSSQLADDRADSAQAWIDGALSEKAGTGTEWYVLALSQWGDYDFSTYEEALLRYLKSNQVLSASSRQKYALCLSAVGSTDGYISAVMEDSMGKLGLMSWIFGLHLLNNGYVSEEYTAPRVVETILAHQCDDGGWALTGDVGDVDVSAMAIQALSVYYGSDDSVKRSVDRALSFLSERQLAQGDYVSYGVENPESGAQVIVALSSMGIDCQTDSRFIKDGNTLFDGILKYRLPDGSFAHKQGESSNQNATMQVFYSMVSYLRMAEGKPPLYVLDRAEPDTVEPSYSLLYEETRNEEDSHESELNGVTEEAEEKEWRKGYKLPVCLILLGIGGAVCLILCLVKKRHVKNFLAVWLTVAVLIGVVLLTNIQTKEEYYGAREPAKEHVTGSVTVTIRCDSVAGEVSSQYIPSNGVILGATEFEIQEGDTVYDLLTEAARRYGLHFESRGTDEMAYIEGIQYLYEFDFGELSGWKYSVNGVEPSVGCGTYRLSPGDQVEWYYSRD